MTTSNVSVLSVSRVHTTHKIQPSHLYQCGMFPRFRGNDCTSIMLDLFKDLCGIYGSIPTLNTVVQNNYRTQTESTVRKLRKIFAMLGDPEQIVSDNGTPFTSREFGEFCTQHGIRHIRSAPYHPATNKEAQRFVQVFKRAIRANSDPTLYSTFPTSASKFDTESEVYHFLQRMSYGTPIYYRTNTFGTTFRTNDSYDTRSYSTSGTASSNRFSTLFNWQSR